MFKRKKKFKINPLPVKDSTGKTVEIYLTYKEYESIFEEMEFLKKKIAFFKEKKEQKEAKEKEKKRKAQRAAPRTK